MFGDLWIWNVLDDVPIDQRYEKEIEGHQQQHKAQKESIQNFESNFRIRSISYEDDRVECRTTFFAPNISIVTLNCLFAIFPGCFMIS